MKIKYMLLALMPLCLASCSEEETVVSAGSQREVRVTAGVGAHSRMVLNDKGQYTESLWQSGDEISLFTSTQSNLVYSTSLEGTSASASFTATGESLQYIEGNEVYACYPTAEAIGEGNQLVKLSPNGSFDYNEGTVRSFCYAVDKISKGSLNFKFKHISAFISLNVTQEMLGGKSLSNGKIMVSTSSTTPLTIGDGDYFDFTTQTATTVNGGNSLVMTMGHVKDSLGIVYLPVLPQPAGADITITLADSEGNDIYTQTKRTPASGFLAGNVYKMDTSASFEVAYLVDGPTFNQSIKDLVSGGSPEDYLIGKIQFVTESYQVPEYHVVVSAEGSAVPVYASFNQADSLLTISTAAKRMEIEDASRMFYNFLSLRTIDFGNFTINETTTDISYLFAACNSLEAVDVSDWNTSLVTNMSCTFAGCSSLTSLDVANWNTDNVTDMSSLFDECTSLTSLDVANWNTTNVANMSRMFDHCSSLISLDLTNWNTTNVANMQGMFAACSSMETLQIAGWNTENVTNMSNMFGGCTTLEVLDIAGWNTANVTDMYAMFNQCSSLSKLDLSNWKTGSVTRMSYMFGSCPALAVLDIADWNVANVTDMGHMFAYCSSLESLDVADWNTSSVNAMTGMFIGCSSLTSLNAANWQIEQVMNMGSMFANCFSLATLDISQWSFNDNSIPGMFADCASVSQACRVFSTLEAKEFLLSKTGETQMNPEWFIWDVDGEVAEVAYLVDGAVFNERIKMLANESDYFNYYDYDFEIGKIKFITEAENVPTDYVVVSVEHSQVPIYASFSKADSLLTISTAAKKIEIVDASNMFAYLNSMRTIDFGNFEINETTTKMEGMFYRCESLMTLDVSNWNTSNVTDMSGMFADCSSLTTLDVSNWNTSNVTDMGPMFFNCSSLTTLDVSNWNTSNVTDMGSMFSHCSSLTTLDVSNWNTSKVISMGSMFSYCSSLTTLDVSNWNTSNVTDMGPMFFNCSSLTTLDVSNWNTSNVTDMGSMFSHCSSLTTLDVSNWNTSKVISMGSMFSYCSSLTTLDVSNWNVEKLNNMESMFQECSSLTTLDVSNWNTSNVTEMGGMFENCSSLTSLDVSNWNTSKVTSMAYMFFNCSSLTALDLASWNTSEVILMGCMFKKCSSLKVLDITGWNFDCVTSMIEMFNGCSSLSMLNISDWDFNYGFNGIDIDGMFKDCAYTSKACRVTSTKDLKDFLLARTSDTSMNPAWFIWGDAENGGSGFGDMSKEEW